MFPKTKYVKGGIGSDPSIVIEVATFIKFRIPGVFLATKETLRKGWLDGPIGVS
jgi:hypothetical protein